MKRYRKSDFPVERVREHLETGPIVLVSSFCNGETNIMTMGWHMMMEFSPALLCSIISNQNHSFALIRKSRQCVINVPTADMIDTVVKIGNTTGAEIDKFAEFGLTPEPAAIVAAPLIGECYASFECRLADASKIEKYNLFIWEVVKAHVSPTPKCPKTLHYKGQGEFRIAGETVSRRRMFRPEIL
jgi:flavin reductase (DIM6/NTAB) family NADH-FMN oxidoreductase RutF